MPEEERRGAPSVPPEQKPGEPDEARTGETDPGPAAKEAEAEAEEDRVDAAPREIT